LHLFACLECARSERSGPVATVAALVVAEDRRFYSHSGTDPIAICRALFQTISGGNIQGGSTIEQQLVRRLTSDYRKSVKRKLKEISLAVRLHRVLRKDQIPIAYLVSAYYGWHMNDVRQAARSLSIDLKDPTVDEAARLIARLRYPEPHHPSPHQSGTDCHTAGVDCQRASSEDLFVVLTAASACQRGCTLWSAHLLR